MSNKYEIVDSIETFQSAFERVKKAQEKFSTYTQDQVDEIFKAAALAANQMRIPLAKLAVEETGMGIVEDKIIKNHYAAEYIYNTYKDEKTCGVIEEDTAFGIKKVAEPIGVIAAVIPTTNPTSTAIFKTLIALKTRNGIIISPHPRAKRSTIEAAKIVLNAAIEAGAPKDIIGWIDVPSMELSDALLHHEHISCILATGGPGMVKAAYSSGKPALGVGPGNVAAVIDETADIKMAVSSILMSKTFDNGMICASEQAVIVVDSIYEEVKKEFIYRGAYLVSKEDEKKMIDLPFIDPKRGTAHPLIVGQPASKIAELSGFSIPADSKILLCERAKLDWEDPFSREKLSPILTMYKAKNFEEATEMAYELVFKGGAGHSSALYTDERKSDRINAYAEKMPSCRVLVNSPSSQGGIGDLFNFKLEPSLSLGCGSWGGNAVSGNIGVENLLNYKTVAERRENMLWFKVPPKVYFKRGCTDLALRELKGKKRAFIVTDRFLFNSGAVDNITRVLDEIGVDHQVFFDVKPDPTLATINEAMAIVRPYEPDVIIALGGGVIGDIAGFAASTYMRGIDFIQIPTTLLSMVDSSVGGKTAIDLPAGKNLLGAFYQPAMVLCDISALNTLPKDVFIDGCAEVIKYGVLYDGRLFAHLMETGLNFDRQYVISRCVELKRNVVAADEFDTGERQLLNLGHTIGHSIEKCSNFSITHGKAVAIGMAVIAKASVAAGYCPAPVYADIYNILERFSLPAKTSLTAQALMDAALSDKKRFGQAINLVLPKKIGECFLCKTPVTELKSFIEAGL